MPLLVLFVTAFVDMIGLTMVIPLLPYYATDFGAGATMIGVLISAFSIAQLAVAPSWGRFSDRYGRRPAILAGLLLTAVAYVLFAFAGSIVALLVSRLIQGTGGGTLQHRGTDPERLKRRNLGDEEAEPFGLDTDAFADQSVLAQDRTERIGGAAISAVHRRQGVDPVLIHACGSPGMIGFT